VCDLLHYKNVNLVLENRTQNLKKNFGRMFWMQALQNISASNLIITLFYLHRGLSLAQVFYLSIIWSITNLVFEVPSSYLADYWGRKKTLILGIVLGGFGDLLLIFSHSFALFAIAMFFISLCFAMFSGTDEALVYDTAKELGSEEKTLGHLGRYFSARTFLKIGMPLLAAFLAKDLFDWQFVSLILVDLTAGILSLLFAWFLVEPKHYFKVEEHEGHILKDAVKLIKTDTVLVKALLTRTVFFIAMFILWRFHLPYLLSIGITILPIGIMWSTVHLVNFLINVFIIKKIAHKKVMSRINNINFIVVLVILLEVVFIYFGFNKWCILLGLGLVFFFESSRWPLYSQLYNERSYSFNRATTLSLANFLKSVLDIPVLFVGSILVGVSPFYPFVFSFILVLMFYVGARFSKNDIRTV